MVDWRKYARIERERRFLLSSPPHPATVVHVRTIVDRYFDGTRLRLRRYNEVDRDPSTGDSSPAVTVCKLTQKVPDPGPSGQQGLITNTYLSEAEYELLARLPCRPLKKTRYSVPPFGVDVFDPPLDGLVLAEAEPATADEADALAPPAGAVADVTTDERFTGGRLVRATREELRSWLAGYGIELGER